MDGYAVRDADLAALPARLRIVGESSPGRRWVGTLEASQCLRIFTGSPVPPGVDRIVIQENVRREGMVAIIEQQPDSPRYIRQRGSDFEQGEQLLPAGRLLDKRAIVTAAGADVAEIEVFVRPRVTIFSTGDELAAPGTAAGRPDAIPESVSLGLAAMAEDWGAAIIDRCTLRDDLGAMTEAAARAVEECDLVVVTGGASVGERDFAKAMFEALDFDLIFSKVAIRPGKPAWFGRAGRALVIGLPGNPTSALVTARLLMAPLLAGLAGREPNESLLWQTATLAGALEECGPRETFHRARRTGRGVEILSFQESSGQRALADADVLVRQPANTPPMAAGSIVDVIDF
jgi:molybdopterin molybdotransferase